MYSKLPAVFREGCLTSDQMCLAKKKHPKHRAHLGPCSHLPRNCWAHPESREEAQRASCPCTAILGSPASQRSDWKATEATGEQLQTLNSTIQLCSHTPICRYLDISVCAHYIVLLWKIPQRPCLVSLDPPSGRSDSTLALKISR